MDQPEHFEVKADWAIFRPVGEVRLQQAVDLATSAIAYAREQHIPKLMIVTTGWRGFKSPSLTDRYFLIHQLAQAARGAVKVAIVTLPEMIDPQKFGIMVARHSGLDGDVFATEEEALTWLNK